MKTINTKEGFGALAVTIAVTVVAIIGGGTFYAVKNADKNNETQNNQENTENNNEDNKSENKGIASIKSLIGLNKNLMCTVSSSVEGVSSNGTLYISGEKMRGSFTSNTQAGAITSNMLKLDQDMYVWSDSKGAKMNLAQLEQQSNTNMQSNNNVDINSDVSYECNDWSPEEEKFIVPSNVEFFDINAMINGSLENNAMFEGSLNGYIQ